MKIRVLESQGIRSDTILAVRVGSLHKQALISTQQPFTFHGNYGHNSRMRIDLLHVVSSSRLNVSGHADTYSVLFPTKPGQESMALTLAVAPETPTVYEVPASGSRDDVYSAEEVEDPESLHRDKAAKAASARAYLEGFQVLTFVQKMLAELLQEQPKDPHRFMADYLLNFLGERGTDAGVKKAGEPCKSEGQILTEALDFGAPFSDSSPIVESSEPQRHLPAERALSSTSPQGQRSASKLRDTFETTPAETAAGPCAQRAVGCNVVRAQGVGQEDSPAEAACGPFSQQEMDSNLVRGEAPENEARPMENAVARGADAELLSASCPAAGVATAQDVPLSTDCQAAKFAVDGDAKVQDRTLPVDSEDAEVASLEMGGQAGSANRKEDPEEIKRKILMVDAQLELLKSEMFMETGPTTPGSAGAGPDLSSTASTAASALQDTLRQNRELLSKQEKLASENRSLQAEHSHLQQAVATFCEGLSDLNLKILVKHPDVFTADKACLDKA